MFPTKTPFAIEIASESFEACSVALPNALLVSASFLFAASEFVFATPNASQISFLN